MSADERFDDVTVVVCTRNSGMDIGPTITSILGSDYPGLRELLVVDQSDDDRTEEALARVTSDPRVRYLRLDEVGVSKSRTLALREARHEFVLSTDDDCVVDAQWVRACADELRRNPRAAIVYGEVVPVADDRPGFTPSSEVEHGWTVRSVRTWRTADGVNVGIGASMAMRRSMLLGIGGFDDRLGPGSEFKNGEDADITIRAVLAGNEVVRSAAPRVLHSGVRSPDEFRRLTRISMFAVGATCGKLIRRRPLDTTRVILGWLRYLMRVVGRNVVHLRRPPIFGQVAYFLKGFVVGLRRPLEPRPFDMFAQSWNDPASNAELAR